jgi:hypothetical protein
MEIILVHHCTVSVSKMGDVKENSENVSSETVMSY